MSLTGEDAARIMNTVKRKMGDFDPYYLRYQNCLTPQQQTKLMNMLTVTFCDFVKEELTRSDYCVLLANVKERFK